MRGTPSARVRLGLGLVLGVGLGLGLELGLVMRSTPEAKADEGWRVSPARNGGGFSAGAADGGLAEG